jgi:methylamine dehydrogenase light chain
MVVRLIDRWTQRTVRQVAHRHGRRSLLTRLGVALVGGAVLPMLPFDRSGQFRWARRPPAAPRRRRPTRPKTR